MGGSNRCSVNCSIHVCYLLFGHSRREVKENMEEDDKQAAPIQTKSLGRRGKKKSRSGLKAAMQEILTLGAVDQQTAQELERLGLEANCVNAISLAAVKAAQEGELDAARFVRDTVGEKPSQALDLEVRASNVRALDLSKLSDEQLEMLADRQEPG